ncbi:hypothetical protein [Pseudovibrio sp. Tun.PSC04-5.I4]|uniref:hypothetical protein n=1 Tax=Pseudovibrio sp. Tun.PSC04-5.I4 TaxID=1798213 RepID=UPI00190ED105|nr:hypothetical protein [Pseudovibrio sp. Tun.PSC04-5.I4]
MRNTHFISGIAKMAVFLERDKVSKLFETGHIDKNNLSVAEINLIGAYGQTGLRFLSKVQQPHSLNEGFTQI